MATLQPGEKIATQGDGWYFIVHVENQSARFHLDRDAFDFRKEDDRVWLTRKSDQQQFLVHENCLLVVLKDIPVAAPENSGVNALFIDPVDPGEYLLLQSTINEEMFLFHKKQLFKIEKAAEYLECTNLK